MVSKGVVKFNVGGMRYDVAHSLLDAHPESMLARIASEEWEQDEQSEIFIERDGARFKYCLDVLRDGKVSLPPTVSKSAILEDLIYYGVDSCSVHYDETDIASANRIFHKTIVTSKKDYLEKLIVEDNKMSEEIERVETELTILKERGSEAKDRIRVFYGACVIYEKIVPGLTRGSLMSKLKIRFDPNKKEDHLTFLAKNKEKHFDNLKDTLITTFGIELISLSVERAGPSPFTFAPVGPFGGGTRNITFPSNANFAANSVDTTMRQDSSSASWYLDVEFIITTGSISNE